MILKVCICHTRFEWKNDNADSNAVYTDNTDIALSYQGYSQKDIDLKIMKSCKL